MTGDVEYQHDTLDDPASQIRLLQILPADKSAPVAMSIETFDRLTAPSYSALSYTWGDPKLSKRLLANGCILDVTENCWYALGQLRLSGFAEYYWVDQLSINQADQNEKSAQVSLMGDTFRNAAMVLVSLGRHTKETAFLFSQIAGNGISCPMAKPPEDIQIDNWLKQIDDMTLVKLLSAYEAFGHLRYWKRLWTAQEFALPANVTVLCGNGCLPWNTFLSFHAMLCKLLRINREYYRSRVAFNSTEQTIQDLPMRETQTLRSTVRSALPRLADFSEVILQHGMRDCSNVKDRIFGLLSLVGWPEGKPRLLPDYSRSKTEIALQALVCSDSDQSILMASLLFNMLEIPPDDVRMLELSRARELQYRRAWSSGTLEELPVTLEACNNCYYPVFDKFSQLSSPWVVVQRHGTPRIWEHLNDAAGSQLPYYEKIALCSSVLPSDTVVRLTGTVPEADRKGSNKLYDKAGLVLREVTEERYEIIGQAYFPAPGFLHEKLDSQRGAVEFDLHLGKEDLLLWTWQLHRMRTPEGAATDYGKALEHLATKFCGKRWSSYATKKKVSSRAVLHDTAVTAAYLTQNGSDVRQALALRKIG